MSHHSDDNMLIATSDSFWEPGNYKRTTKRIEDGHKLCDSLIALVQERAEIEKSYAKALKNWSKNWNDKIEKGPEYGTTEAAWKGVLVESDRLCDLHLRVKENLCNDIIQQVKTWQKDTYHKSMMTLKERKEMEDAFKKAQKPWAKLLQKVEKAKSEYHNSCKTERTAANMERNASADSSLSPDQVKKMQDRVQKTKEEVQKAKEKYEAALQEINQYNPKYMEDMTQVFEKCQEMEAQRLQFFKDVLFGIHKCLNISQDPVLPQIYEEFYHTINNADHEKDLKWWSNNHGVNMAMNWPQFEDYTEEFREITKGSKSKEALPAGSITLINQRPVGEDLHVKFCYVYTTPYRHTHTETYSHGLFECEPRAHSKSMSAYFSPSPPMLSASSSRSSTGGRSIDRLRTRPLLTDVPSRSPKTRWACEVIQDGFPFSAF